MTALFYLSKIGRHPKQRIDRVDKRDVELLNKKTDHEYCRIPTKQTNYSSRLGVSPCSDLKQMETCIHKYNQNVEGTRYGSLCFPPFP